VDSTRKDQLVEALLSYGLNEYEARAYLALLQHGPAVAGEISRRSGIPRPRVYDTLQRLIEASLVTEHGGAPRRYAPLPLDDFLHQVSSQFRRRQELLKSSLATPSTEHRNEGLFHVHDEVPLLRAAEDLVDGARTHVHVLASGVDATHWSRALDEARERGVILEGVLYGPIDVRNEGAFRERPSGDNRTAQGGRRLLVVRDREELLMGELGGTMRPYGVRTRNRLLVDWGRRAPAGGEELSDVSAWFEARG
jgi:sugar-specific transcriptional regulator TrmB